MGIKGLMKLINDKAPGAVKEQEMANYFGRKVAVDASMSLYQFLIAVRSGPEGSMLTNEFGEVTSHLQGMFYRTIRMMEHGIKPLYVFDGKPPELKKGELDKRKEAKAKAEAAAEEAKKQEATAEEIARFERRTVRVTKEQNEEAKRLLRLMGVPVVEAPCEAEAMCAALCRAGKVYCTATEDMDALTFGTTRLCRNMTFSAARKMPIIEISLERLLDGMRLTMDQFIDLCVLLGCDYTGTLRGIGPVTAYKLISEHGSTEKALKHVNHEKHPGADKFIYKEAAALFKAPEVTDPAEVSLQWTAPDVDGIVDFLCKEKGFDEDRVRNSCKKLIKAKDKSQQRRLDSFFGAKPGGGGGGGSSSSSAAKRKGMASGKKKPTPKKARK